MKNVIISKLVSYRPSEKILNKELEKDLKGYYSYLDKVSLDDPIYEKVGIKERPTVRDSQTATDIAVICGQELLSEIKIDSNKKMAIITGTLSAEDRWPSVSAKIMRSLNLIPKNGYDNITGYDIDAACSGWTFAVEDARAKILIGGYDSAIIFSTDIMTRLVDKHDKSRILFGDGATAAFLEEEKKGSSGFRISGVDSVTYAQMPKDVYYPTELALDVSDENERNRMNLKGEEVYESGVEYSASFIEKYLEKNNLSLDDFDYVIPHQANGSMLDSLEKRLGLDVNKKGSKKLLSNIENTGNTAASSIPLCLFDFEKKGEFQNGDRILMCSFGAGYTLGIVDVVYVR